MCCFRFNDGQKMYSGFIVQLTISNKRENSNLHPVLALGDRTKHRRFWNIQSI